MRSGLSLCVTCVRDDFAVAAIGLVASGGLAVGIHEDVFVVRRPLRMAN